MDQSNHLENGYWMPLMMNSNNLFILQFTQLHNVTNQHNGILYLIELYDFITLYRCADYIILISFSATEHCYVITQ